MIIEWTTDTPKEPGFYWARSEYDSIDREIICVSKSGNRVYWDEFGTYCENSVSGEWKDRGMVRSVNPLEVPE